MSLPIQRASMLTNVGVIVEKKDESFYFFLVHNNKEKNEIHILAMQKIEIRKKHTTSKFDLSTNTVVLETKMLGTPYHGGYGAAIHDFVLWFMQKYIKTTQGPQTKIISVTDRNIVSSDATRVREIYAKTRIKSVHAFPIDNFRQPLTKTTEDDYWTHFEHGGFDVYPEHKGKTMANDPQAYKDWALELTPQGYEEIGKYAQQLLVNGENIFAYLMYITHKSLKSTLAKIHDYGTTLFTFCYKAMKERIRHNDYMEQYNLNQAKILVLKYSSQNLLVKKATKPWIAPTIVKTKREKSIYLPKTTITQNYACLVDINSKKYVYIFVDGKKVARIPTIKAFYGLYTTPLIFKDAKAYVAHGKKEEEIYITPTLRYLKRYGTIGMITDHRGELIYKLSDMFIGYNPQDIMKHAQIFQTKLERFIL